MAYSTVTDLKNYLPKDILQILSDDNNADNIDVEKVNFAIREADNRIDGYLRGRYTLPLASVPFLITEYSVRLTVYFLYIRGLSTTLPDSLKENYKDVNSSLKEIQAGRLNPFDPSLNPTWYVSSKPAGSASTVAVATNGWNDYLVRSTGTPGYNQNTRFLNPGSL